MAMTTKVKLVRMRTIILAKPRVEAGAPVMGSCVARERESRPSMTSTVVRIGRALEVYQLVTVKHKDRTTYLRGVLVNGTIAMHTTIITLKAVGYIDALFRIFDVI